MSEFYKEPYTEPPYDWQNPNQPNPSASNQENAVNIEDPNMWSQVSTYIANKLTTASDLAKRVGELERQVEMLKDQNTALQQQWADEHQSHAVTRRELQIAMEKLDHEQRAVHDLVMERDIVVEERNAAQRQRDEANAQVRTWNENYVRIEGQLQQEIERNRVLTERSDLLAQRLQAFKAAFSGLSDL